MQRARILPFAPQNPADRVVAAKGVVLRADRLSLLDLGERRAILDLAWTILRKDHRKRLPPGVADPCAQPDALPDPDRVVTLAKARLRRRQTMTLGPHPARPRPRIVVRPANPTTPGDAA